MTAAVLSTALILLSETRDDEEPVLYFLSSGWQWPGDGGGSDGTFVFGSCHTTSWLFGAEARGR